jgi:hypothetical protein
MPKSDHHANRSERLTLAHRTSAKPSDRRAAPRARVVLDGSWSELARTRPVRISGLSQTGCYVVTLPRTGEALDVRVELPQGALQARGVVVYTEPLMGFGLQFLDLPSEVSGLLAGAVEMLNRGTQTSHTFGPTSMVA